MLTTTDVGRILGEERAKRDGTPPEEAGSLRPKTISQYLVDSKPGNRYADHPFPEPAYRHGLRPFWTPDQEAAIREWARSRPGPGHGGGRPWDQRSAAEKVISATGRFMERSIRERYRALLEENGVDETKEPRKAAKLAKQAETEVRESMRTALETTKQQVA
jgi:hypothetical protein